MILKRTLRGGQIIFYQGEAAIQTFRVTSGLVRGYIIHDNGEEATIAYFGPDDIFPVASSFDIAPVTLFYYETVGETSVEVMKPVDFTNYIDRAPKEELKRFARRYVGALLHISALTQTSAKAKLVHTLRYLAIRFGVTGVDKSYIKIPIKLTQQDLARLCSASRETVSLELTHLKKDRVVIVKEKLYVVHLERLNSLMNEDQIPNIHLQ